MSNPRMTERTKANWQKVISYLETEAAYPSPGKPVFNMKEWNCGTTACIGGTAEIIYAEEEGIEDLYSVSNNDLRNWLGIDGDIAWLVFYSPSTHWEYGVEWEDTEPQDAIKAIRNVMNGATNGRDIWADACRDMLDRQNGEDQ